MPITYHVVVPFDRNSEGELVPGEAKEAPNRDVARRRAQTLAVTPPHVGALAFTRTGNPDSGDFQEGEVIAEFGEVSREALQGEGRKSPRQSFAGDGLADEHIESWRDIHPR